jgi:hypothetical protein
MWNIEHIQSDPQNQGMDDFSYLHQCFKAINPKFLHFQRTKGRNNYNEKCEILHNHNGYVR